MIRAVVVALLVAAPVQGQMVARAMTDCKGRDVVVSIAPDVVWGSTEHKMILAHEAVHVVQAGRYPSCKAFLEAYASGAVAMARAEVEAWCAALPVAVAAGLDRGDVFSDFVGRVLMQPARMGGAAFGTVDLPWVFAEFKRQCPGEIP